jgi:hypothetical protein
MNNEIVIRDHTMDDVRVDKVIRLIQKCYFDDGWRKENLSKVGRGYVSDERIRELHKKLIENKLSKNILAERNGKVICDMTGILIQNLYNPIIKEVDIFVWCEDKDEETNDTPQKMLDIMIQWGKEMKATSIRATINIGWEQSVHLPYIFKERYGFEPLELICYKSI